MLAGKVRELKSRYERNHVIVEFEGSSAFLRAKRLPRPKTSPATLRSASSRTATRKSCSSEASAAATYLSL